MPDLNTLRNAIDYIIGTELAKTYQQTKTFELENILDKEKLRKRLRNLNLEAYSCWIIGKAIPNLTLIGYVTSTITADPIYLLGTEIFLRLVTHNFYTEQKEKLLRYRQNTLVELSKTNNQEEINKFLNNLTSEDLGDITLQIEELQVRLNDAETWKKDTEKARKEPSSKPVIEYKNHDEEIYLDTPEFLPEQKEEDQKDDEEG